MGIIRKQATQTTLLNFIGIAFGSISRIMMPFFISKAQIGLLNILDSISGTFYSVFNFGYNLLLKKMFPQYRSEEKSHHGFFALGLMISFTGITCALITYYFFQDYILSSKAADNELLLTFSFLIPPLIVFRILAANTDGYVRMLFNTVIGAFFESFLTKILMFGAMVLVAFTLVSFELYLYIYVSALMLPGLVIVIYAWLKTPKVVMPDRELWVKRKEVSTYLLFGVLGGASTSIVLYIDQLMLNKMISLSAVGVYSIMFFASNLISIPSRNLRRISNVIVAEAWKKDDREEIQDIYQKSAINLLIIGIYLFFIGWWLLPVALEFLPDYKEGLYVFFFLGLARVVDLGTGINSDIIETGPKFKWNTYMNILFALVVFGTNMVFIPMYGLVGAGLASCISLVSINIVRLIFLKHHFGFTLASPAYFKTLLVGVAFILLAHFAVLPFSPILSMTLIFIVGTAAFAFVTLKMKLSTEVNDAYYKVMKRIGRK